MKRDMSTLYSLLKVFLGIGLLVYLSISGAIDWKMLYGLTRAWDETLIAFCLVLLGLGISGWRLCLLMKPAGFYLSVGSSLKLTLIGTFFNICLPGASGGDAVRVYYAMGGNKGQRMEVATIILFDRIIGMFALIILPLLIATVFPEHILSFRILTALLLSGIVMAVILLGVIILSFSAISKDGSSFLGY